jgi:arginase
VGTTDHLNRNHNRNRAYHIVGVPLRTGSLYPGSENDAQGYRDAQLVARLQAACCDAIDEGDVAIPSYLPHHTVPPIRNWPGPRIAWDCISDRVAPILRQPGQVPLLIGCDCSVIVGTTQALTRAGADEVHVLYIDGDFDDATPRPDRYQSAAALAIWLVTHASPFWQGPPLKSSHVTVIGAINPSASEQPSVRSQTLADVRRTGAAIAAQQALADIPPFADIIVHFDIDVFEDRSLPAAYFPHADGLTTSEAGDLLRVLLQDPRIRIIEVTEYAVLRDIDRRSANQLVDLLCHALKP